MACQQTLLARQAMTAAVLRSLSLCRVNGGKVYYINKARITTANILAGQAVIHEVRLLLAVGSFGSARLVQQQQQA